MKSSIHIETPEGEIVKHVPELTSDKSKPTPAEKEEAAQANAAGPKVNPDERANGNLTEEEKKKATEQGTGSEITDGEGG